jgi:hypothetical protein
VTPAALEKRADGIFVALQNARKALLAATAAVEEATTALYALERAGDRSPAQNRRRVVRSRTA